MTSQTETADAQGASHHGSRNWLTIARRDFTDARRSRVLGLAIGLFVLFVGLVVLTTSTDGPNAAMDVLWNIQGVGLFFMPIVVLIVGYLSIAGERETGRIKYLLGWPNRRRDVIVGKFLSRTLVSLLAVGLSMLLGTIGIAVRYSSFPAEEIVLMTVLMAFFAVVYTGIAVGVSAMAATRGRAMGGVIGIFVTFTVLWSAPSINPQESMAYIVEDLLGLAAKPNLYEFVFHLSPSFAYGRLANGFVFERVQDGAQLPASDAPFYIQDWFMAVIMAGWVVAMLAVGYLRFRDAELG
jgi:ABC-2 type transport system permease protein